MDPIAEIVPPWTPNTAQVQSFVRTIFKYAGSALTTYAGIHLSSGISDALTGPVAVQFGAGIIMAAWPLFWDWIVHSRDGKLHAVESMPSVQKILIDTAVAPSDVKAIVDDKDRPKVDPLPVTRDPIYPPPDPPGLYRTKRRPS
jgi:hypothetical protein